MVSVQEKKDVEPLEGVKRRVTILVYTLRDLPYELRLKKLDISSLTHRRSRGNMIETYKVMNGSYDEWVPIRWTLRKV